jgi:predicted dehydrogenase
MTVSPGSSPLGILVVGCGTAGEMHSKTLSAKAFGTRRYYTDWEPRLARDSNARFEGSGWFDSLEAGLGADGVDVALVTTPPDSHLEVTLKALAAGRHVIVEKPAFLRSEDFDAAQEAASAAGRQVFVAENYFYKPILERLRNVISAGLLGEVRFLHINALKEQPFEGWRSDPKRSGGGILFEGGVHWINFVANLGLSIGRISGVRVGAADGPEKSIAITIEYQNGAVGTLHYSWEIPAPLGGLRVSRIFGSEGHVAFESNGILLFRKKYGRAVPASIPRVSFPGLVDLLGYKAMFADFLGAMRDDREPRMTLRHARRDVELIEEVYRSL